MVRRVSGSFDKDVSGQFGVDEPVVIDANGSHVEIRLHGDAEVRNVWVKNSTNHPAAFHVKAGAGEEITLENCGVDKTNDNGVFVNNGHAGKFRMVRCYMANQVEDAIYASPPGNPDIPGKGFGQEGRVEIEQCVAENCGDYSWRMGSKGSYVENSVVRDGQVCLANLWGNRVEFRNCDIQGSIGVRAGSPNDKNASYISGSPEIVLENCRADVDQEIDDQTVNAGPEITGSFGSNPDLSAPAGCPETEQEMIENASKEAPAPDPEPTDPVQAGPKKPEGVTAGDMAVGFALAWAYRKRKGGGS